MRFLYYNPLIATAPNAHSIPGMERFALFAGKISLAGTMFLDRTNTIRTPIKTLSTFRIPEYAPFHASYEDVCNKRAQQLHAHAEKLGVRLYVFYSGGIDSTCMLVSLLKNASEPQRKNITVLLNENSILEYPNFYNDHIRGKLTCEISTMFPYLLGTKNLLVTAELSDLVFGSDFLRPFVKKQGLQRLLQPYDRDLVLSHFTLKLEGVPQADKEALFYVNVFEKIKDKAPMPLTTHFDVFWWLSFCLKWQFISVRLLAFTADRNATNITAEYAHDYYTHFYDTEDFQRWSMNNLDKRIKDDWKTYKWPAKDVIYSYTKDADYRDNKTKKGSLSSLLVQQNPFHYVTEDYTLHRDLPAEEYTDPENDFV